MNYEDSRIPGFYRLPLVDRQSTIATRLGTSTDELRALLESGGLTMAIADKTVENVVGRYALPLGLALNFRVNGTDRIVPMVVEEPSVIAAASNAARLVRSAGGFTAQMTGALMTGQIELRDVHDPQSSITALTDARDSLIETANAAVPNLVQRGGGVKAINTRNLGDGHLVFHFEIDCRDAMGANLINTVAERLGARVASIARARLGLRILTNLCDQRRVRASCRIAVTDLAPSSSTETPTHRGEAGLSVARAIEEAALFAEIDPYRAATHNKGIMNGIDSVVLATGNDFRAAEAGAHAWAARTGRYGSLSEWHVVGEHLVGSMEMPLSLGIVGGTIRVHPLAQWAIKLLGVESASELSEIAACVGLASNFSALRALATEGIQRGHMSLQARSVAVAAGAKPDEVDIIAEKLAQAALINETTARLLLDELRSMTIERQR